MTYLYYQGNIANSDQETFEGQIKINMETGLIDAVAPITQPLTDKPDLVFPSYCIIFPGMGDTHIHARQDETGKQCYKEEYKTAANAALNGGLVHVSAMPNTPNPLTTKEQFAWHSSTIKQLAHSVSILNYVGIGKGTRPLKRKVPYKAYTGPSVGSLFFKSKEEFEDAIRHYPNENVSLHIEDYDVLMKNAYQSTHSKRRPVICVDTALEYVLPIIEKYRIKAKLCHWSTGNKSFDLIAEHRDRMEKLDLGYNTTIEVSPEHLLFDEDMLIEMPELWPSVQMNPAIQARTHRKQLISGLRTGFIDMIASDHAPHSLDEKYKMFTIEGLEAIEQNSGRQFTNLSLEQVDELKAYILDHKDLTPEQVAHKLLLDNKDLCRAASCEDGTSGAPWLDTHSMICSYLLQKHDFSACDISRVTAYNPGIFVNEFLDESYGKGFGKIERGYQGSLTVLNINKSAIVSRENLKTKCGWSPLEGQQFSGGLEAVIVRGHDVTGHFL